MKNRILIMIAAVVLLGAGCQSVNPLARPGENLRDNYGPMLKIYIQNDDRWTPQESEIMIAQIERDAAIVTNYEETRQDVLGKIMAILRKIIRVVII